MAEAEEFELQEERVVILEEKHLPATEETHLRVLFTLKGVEKHEDESDSVTQPLLQRKHQGSRVENDKTDTRTATAGPDRATSVPHELELAGRDHPGCSGSVRSLCSDSSRRECPICRELFDSRGDHRITLLNCDHTLCHHCTAGIMRRAKEPGRLRCPFCRQTTPFPQWEIRRLQEESYSDWAYQPGPSLVISSGPEPQTVPASPWYCFALERHLGANICRRCVCPSCFVRGLRVMRLYSLCLSITGLLLLFLVLLGCFFYIVVPLIAESMLFSNS